ncbi:hypothetical protein VTI28DRAFT_7489 [Corynascus sepedonium]
MARKRVAYRCFDNDDTTSLTAGLFTRIPTDDEIARLRQLLADERRRCEKAEEVAEGSRPLLLESYLEACHSLSLTIDVVINRSLTIQGDATNPIGRVYPRRILPWDDILKSQERIWSQLGPCFGS